MQAFVPQLYPIILSLGGQFFGKAVRSDYAGQVGRAYGPTRLQKNVQATKETDRRRIGLFWGKSYHRWLMQQSMAAEAS